LFNCKTNLGKFGISRLFAFMVYPIRMMIDFWPGIPDEWKMKRRIEELN